MDKAVWIKCVDEIIWMSCAIQRNSLARMREWFWLKTLGPRVLGASKASTKGGLESGWHSIWIKVVEMYKSKYMNLSRSNREYRSLSIWRPYYELNDGPMERWNLPKTFEWKHSKVNDIRKTSRRTGKRSSEWFIGRNFGPLPWNWINCAGKIKRARHRIQMKRAKPLDVNLWNWSSFWCLRWGSYDETPTVTFLRSTAIGS